MRVLWRLFRGLAIGDLSQYSISQNIQTASDYVRLIVVIEALQTAIAGVWTINLSGITRKHRIELFSLLVQRLENFSAKALKFRKQFKEKEKGSSADGDNSSEFPLPRLPTDSFHLVILPVVGVDRCCIDCIELEAEFLTQSLDVLRIDEEISDVSEEEYQWRQSLIGLDTIDFLRRHLRERYIRVLEASLRLIEDVAISKSVLPFIPSMYPSYNHPSTALPVIRMKFQSLYCQILLDLMMMRTEALEQAKEKTKVYQSLLFTSPSINLHSCKQLALRGLLGCIRFEIFLGLMLSNSISQRESSLISLLDQGTNRSWTSSALTNNVARTLDFHARKFLTLCLNLHETDRGDAALAVLILGEISILLNSEKAKVVQELIVQQCNEKLSRLFICDLFLV